MPAVLEPPIEKKSPEFNQTGIDYRRAMPRAPVKGRVIDAHVHLLGRRHAEGWFDGADHFGLDHFITQSPLEEAAALQRDFGDRLTFVAVPNWFKLHEAGAEEDWLRRLESFHNLGARMAKIHLAPGTMQRTGLYFEHPTIQRVLKEIRDRGMIIMTHVGDPQLWYDGKYTKVESPLADLIASREKQYRQWEDALETNRGTPWLGAHLGGWPENLAYMQGLLDRFPDLYLDLSATRWMVREVSRRREEAREFMLRNVDRILWGSDQVSADNRGWDFLASRWWCHRKLFETGFQDTTPILDPDLPAESQPILRGLALPVPALQKLYRDNAVKLMSKVGLEIE